MLKKLLQILLPLTLLTGCAVENGMRIPQKIKIGISVYDRHDTFLSLLMDDFKSEISYLDNVSISISDAENDQLKQNGQVKEMIHNGYDVICVNLVDRTAPRKIIDMAKASDIPIIFFNRELVEEDMQTWAKLYYIGSDAKEAGEQEGQIVIDGCAKQNVDKNGDGFIQYVVLEGEAGHQDAVVRTEQSVATILKAGIELDKLGAAIANWNRAEARTKTNQLFHDFGSQIELILSNNDDMALGAIDALSSAPISKEEWPFIVGIDGTPDSLQAIKDGLLNGTVYNDAAGQAKAMAELSYRLATGKGLGSLHLIADKYIRLPHEIVTQENVDSYMERCVSQ